MSFSPIPDVTAPDIFTVTPKWLSDKGITLLLLDLDNTLAPYSQDMPTEQVLAWMKELQASGAALFIVSNNRGETRVERYAAACGIPFIKRAEKPHPKGLETAMEQMGKTREETALMGDQVFTDALAAKRAGVLSIVIKPLEMLNMWFYLRYFIELPFRWLSKERYQ